MKSMVETAHAFLEPVIHSQAVCIDATLGRGRDTLFFLKLNPRQIHCFEVQENLVRAFENQIVDSRIILHLTSHALLKETLSDDVSQADAVVFNFGYDPYTLQGICTQADSSLSAVLQAADLLRKKGRMALIFYPHEEGKKEASLILEALKKREDLELMAVSSLKENSPWCLLVQKMH